MKLPIIIAALLLGSVKIQQSANAKAEKVNGLDVYVYSEPVNNYEVIDSGKIIATLTGSCGESVNASIKKAAKLNADAVLINLENSRWEAISY